LVNIEHVYTLLPKAYETPDFKIFYVKLYKIKAFKTYYTYYLILIVFKNIIYNKICFVLTKTVKIIIILYFTISFNVCYSML